MIELKNLGKLYRGRVWINECPDIKYPATEKRTVEIGCFPSEIWERKTVCLELNNPGRHVSSYALLGMEFIPGTSDRVVVELTLSADYEKPFGDSLRRPSREDVVSTGIPREYAKSILDTTQELIKKCIIPKGKLNINVGAHSLVGSSRLIFSRVATMVVKIIMRDLNAIQPADVKQIVLEELDNWAEQSKNACNQIE